jgi:LysM repeat protein
MTLAIGLTPATSPIPAQATPAVVSRANAAPFGWRTLTVRAGDTLSDLAVTHRTTVGVLITRNHLRGDGDFLAVGERLWVPRVKSAPRAAPAAARTSIYVIRTGDTLSEIAAHHKVRLSTLYSLNDISRTAYIQPGQRLRLPASAVRRTAKAGARATVSTTTLTVRSGDTLSAIALRRGISQASLMKANGLSSRSILQIGQKLKVVNRVTRKAYSSNTFAGRTYSNKVVSAASVNRAYLSRHAVPSRMRTKAMIIATARRHGVDPTLALAISWQESGWNQRQVSVANAIGTMQVIPSSGVWASDLAGTKLDLLNAQDNITAGVIILRSLTRSARTQQEAIAGYYQGLYSVQKHGMYADTKHYVSTIMVLKGRM